MKQAERRRLGIFLCYDPDGVIDDYITYLLNDLKENLSQLVVVVNGRLSPEGRKRLETITSDVVARENLGFDFGAWKFVLTEYLGWDALENYDVLVLLNDSCFGPFYPFAEIFSKMQGKADFWGLVEHGEVKTANPFNLCPYGYLPAHLQSSFLVVEDRLLHSAEFHDYWVQLPPAQNYQEAVAKNECVFTKHFFDLGFSYAALIDTKDMDGNSPTAHAFFSPGHLLLRGMPMLKAKAFSQNLDDLLNVHMGDDLAVGMAYIRQHTQYDEKLIWQHVLRRYNIADIHDTMHLDYIISDRAAESIFVRTAKVLVLLHLYYLDLLEEETPYIAAIPSYMDVLVTTMSDEQKSAIEKAYGKLLGSRLQVIVMQNRGREAASLLVAAKPYFTEYDYICFCQDKKSSQVPYGTGASFSRLGWENMLASRTYIENIISTFERESQLGILVPPRFFGGLFLYNLPSNLWTICYDRTVSVAKQLGLHVDICPDKGIICTNSMFWARTKALDPLLRYEWKYEDFEGEPTPVDGALRHVIERILQFVAQDAGYYTGIVMTPEYAAIQTSAFFHLVQREMRRGLELENALHQATDPVHWAAKKRTRSARDWLKRRVSVEKWTQLRKLYYKLGGKGIE
ncbi:hypothetical protein SDC9_64951 [bioreactor metagenome]|uniref:Rhamnan synthesis protein F n=1 Tax=bioreactor metagenome TaxID=1076179 RepID=A0A644XR23_9ZZZZ